MHCRCAGHAGAGLGDGAHHDRRLDDAKPRAAEFFRNADAQPARIGHGLVEIMRKTTFAVLLQPIGVIKIASYLRNRIPDCLLIFPAQNPCSCSRIAGVGGSASATPSVYTIETVSEYWHPDNR